MTPTAVRALRVSRGHTQAVAARIAGVSTQTWYRWESGRYPADIYRLALYRIRTDPDPASRRGLEDDA